ncbi:MAG: tetratricopeptide repeat protein, partial [Planctomycetaceae bacterium]
MLDPVQTLLASSDESDATFLELSRTLTRVEGFTLLIAVCNEPARQNRLLDRLDAVLESPAIRVVVPADCEDVLAFVELSLTDHASISAVMVTEFASGIRSVDVTHPKLRALNHRREEWRESVPAPVVFWLPEYLLQPLAQQAPDFLDWRSGTFLFLDPLGRAAESSIRGADSTPEIWRFLETERRERMAQLREWLAPTPSDRDGKLDPAKIRWLLELAEHHQRLGEYHECLQIARNQALPIIPTDDKRSQAFAWSLIADVLQSRGELDEALRIRREEQLPVYERLGDVRSRAVTMGQIADILQSRGELDEALRIRREKELPVYERLGDVRSRAVTMGKIADILQSRGELDEALRIRREEQLPVYERLGDVRSRAVTMGKIA